MWNKNIADLNPKEIAECQKILARYQLRVADIASPLFKVDWPGAPRSKTQERDQFHASADFHAQDEVLTRCISLAKVFGTDRIRCFDFWRIEDPNPTGRPSTRNYRKPPNVVVSMVWSLSWKTKCLATRPPGPRRRALSRPSRRTIHAQLGSGQRSGCGRNPLPRRIRFTAQTSHRPLPLQGCGKKNPEVGSIGRRSVEAW